MADLCRRGVQATGRQGLPAEAVLRCALLEQHRQLSDQELAFHLEDSASFRAFARLPWAWSPKNSVLQQTIGALRAETWEAINRALLASAAEAKLERGRMVRLDSTVTAALVHEPSDSSLLWDAVRVMARLLKQAKALGAGLAGAWRDHRRAAKRRARDIECTRGRPRRVQLYRELITITRANLASLREAARLYFLFYVLPDLGILLSPLTAGALGLGPHYSTYTAEVCRAGIETYHGGSGKPPRRAT